MPFTNDDDPGIVDDIVHTQLIARETVEYLRSLKKDMQITTGKIERGVVEALRNSKLIERVGNLERTQTSTRTAFIRGLTSIVKFLSGDD